MEGKVTTESGIQLLARLNERPSLLHMDDILFPGGPEPGDIIQISGPSSVGKTILLLKFLTKCLLPKSIKGVDIGGLDTGVIFIDTDHNFSILKLISLMEKYLRNACNSDCNKDKRSIIGSIEEVEGIITDSLKKLFILKTYSSMQLEMNFHSLEKILYGHSNVSLLIIDSLTAYYWSDITNHKSIKKMDLYLKVLIDKIKKCIKEFKLVTIFVTQEYFQCKQSEYSSPLLTHKIELRKNEDLDNFLAYIDSQKTVCQYRVTDNGFIASCGYFKKFEELSSAIKAAHPNVIVESSEGRTGSFEVTINDTLVYSKLRTMAFPVFENVLEVIGEVESGMPPRKIEKQEPITSCVIV